MLLVVYDGLIWWFDWLVGLVLAGVCWFVVLFTSVALRFVGSDLFAVIV